MMTASFAFFTMYRFGYDAHDTGWLFVFVGIIAAIIQGGLIGGLVKRFGELSLVVTGVFLFAASLFVFPFTGPQTGLLTLLIVGATFSIGNSLSGPALTGLASKSVGRGEQGGVLGITQAVASLARIIGPVLSSALIYSAVMTYGFDRKLHNLSEHSLRLTFWTAAAIMFGAFLIALYFTRTHAADYTKHEVAATGS
jgi:DHA1 family tetracycline resistance protein-like MFS transporter